MSDLAEFLLARIAEDEDMGRLMAQMAGNVDLLRGPVSPARVLAECEAKRRIVERAEVWADHLDEVLRLLALPYADHPDYREEWRP